MENRHLFKYVAARKKAKAHSYFLKRSEKVVNFLHSVRLFFNKLDNKRNLNNFDIDINN